ncbi:MAG TPA: F0F1 ATP synthase subunit delta [Patescibacteria group bacterium]|nr:F0F1 ATP synthase subunit delta [Patescibacteria group bacterium]
MKTSRRSIAQIIASQTLSPKYSSKKQSKKTAAYLVSEGRVRELNSILRDVQSDWAEAGYVEVEAVCAHQIDKNNQQIIKSQIAKLYPKAKKINITEVIDPNILGGIRLNVVNDQLDISLRTKLNNFENLIKDKI